MWGAKPEKESKKEPEKDATTSFLSSISTPREIRKPIEVQERDKKEKVRTADEYEIIYNPETDARHPYEKWRRNFILKCLISREIARYLDRRTFITVSVREALIYIIFLILITLITFRSTPLDMFYFSQAMATLYTKQKFMSDSFSQISFYDITTMSDMWKYLGTLDTKLFHSFWYTKPNPFESPEHDESLFYENKLIGAAQIRQVRVKPSECDIHDETKDLFKNDDADAKLCYGQYSTANEETGIIIGKNDIDSVGGTSNLKPHNKYTSDSVTKSMPISGTLATYGGGGYVVLVKRGDYSTVNTIAGLRNNLWWGRPTRAVFVEFTIYNGNVNLFCIFKLIFEIPPTGGVIPSHWNYVQKLIRYTDPYDYFILACEVIFGIFFIFFTIQKLLEIITLRTKLLFSFWNWIDIVILVMCYLVVIFEVILISSVNEDLPELVNETNGQKYPSFDKLCFLYVLYSYSFAILIAFAFFRLLKYLNIVHAMYQLQSTISRATPHILSYCVMFFYIYFVFALVGLYLFGNKLEDYKTFPMAVFALMRSSVGDFNYQKLVQADPICGPIFFFAFVFFIAFILVNVFLAILVSKYEEVRSEVRIGGVKTFIGDMLKYWFLRCLEKAGCLWLLSQLERRRFEQKIRSPTEAIRQYLRQAGYSELEIELFFKKYDITDAKISAMDEDRFSYRQGEREAPPPLSQKDILRYIVIQKLEYLENHYQAANKLIDEFLSKLNKFEAKK